MLQMTAGNTLAADLAHQDYSAKERSRIEKMVPRFLVPMLDKSWDILSIGCGAGTDVRTLRKLGYKAWGLDPSRLPDFGPNDNDRSYFRVCAMEDLPFGDQRFDFAFALDVIEHVGCRNFGTVVTDGTADLRKRFIESCLKVLKPGGMLVLTTSNKLFPIDPGHWHKYHWLGKLCAKCEKFGLSIPWSKRNFLCSLTDIRTIVAAIDVDHEFDVAALPVSTYPSFTGSRKPAARIATSALKLLDGPAMRASPLAPLLVIGIRRRAAPTL